MSTDRKHLGVFIICSLESGLLQIFMYKGSKCVGSLWWERYMDYDISRQGHICHSGIRLLLSIILKT